MRQTSLLTSLHNAANRIPPGPGFVKQIAKLACGLALTGLCAGASGQSLFSTLNSTPASWWDTGQDSVALAFTTGSQSESIASVTLDLYAVEDSTFQLAFHNAGSGQPGTLVNNGLLTDPATQVAFTGGPVAGSIPNTYTASGLTLAANTSYWLVFSDPGAGTGVANTQLNAPVTSGSGDFTLGDTYYSPNGGPWYDAGQNFVPLAGIYGTTAVPEPSTLALAILGGSSLLFRRRK